MLQNGLLLIQATRSGSMRSTLATSETTATDLLNSEFECPGCRTCGSWAEVAKAKVRQYSTVHRLKCSYCGEQIAAKTSRTTGRSHGEDAGLFAEYQTLYELWSKFPQDDHFGTLMPLGYLGPDRDGIMVTRWFGGDDLVRHARNAGMDAIYEICRSAGVWLQKLHRSDQGAWCTRSLGVADKINYLLQTYGRDLRTDRKTRVACEVLEHEAGENEAFSLRAAHIHGDFKPENMLCNGFKYVGLDIHMQSIGAIVYDLAPFLNHMWLVGQPLRSFGLSRSYAQGEAGLLDGYGGIDEHEKRALRWVQLYFALCHLGSYRRRSWLSRVYANQMVWPLARNLMIKLQELH